MRFRLRTLMIVLALGPMVLAGGYFKWQRHIYYQRVVKPLINGMKKADAQRQWRLAIQGAMTQQQPAPPADIFDSP